MAEMVQEGPAAQNEGMKKAQTSCALQVKNHIIARKKLFSLVRNKMQNADLRLHRQINEIR
jgi:hypothetical protein